VWFISRVGIHMPASIVTLCQSSTSYLPLP
jgi:hypothetical protein